MIAEQLSVGLPQTVEFSGRSVETGIFKTPVDGPLAVRETNIDGDRQADLRVHGGRDKAVYAYPHRHYSFWARQLGVDALEPAQFGENLTISDCDERSVLIGECFEIGTALMRVAQPRLPCYKLGIRMGDAEFPQRFLDSGKLGFYLRVEREGEIQVGDQIVSVDRPEHGFSVHKLWALAIGGETDRELAGWAQRNLPHLDRGWRKRLQRIMDA